MKQLEQSGTRQVLAILDQETARAVGFNSEMQNSFTYANIALANAPTQKLSRVALNSRNLG